MKYLTKKGMTSPSETKDNMSILLGVKNNSSKEASYYKPHGANYEDISCNIKSTEMLIYLISH